MRSNAVRKTAALIMVGGLTALIVGAAGQFMGSFKSTSRSPAFAAGRTGHELRREGETARGDRRRVKSVGESDGQAILKLDMDSDQMSSIPANVTAEIKSTPSSVRRRST